MENTTLLYPPNGGGGGGYEKKKFKKWDIWKERKDNRKTDGKRVTFTQDDKIKGVMTSE